jgi:hypothetical protein
MNHISRTHMFAASLALVGCGAPPSDPAPTPNSDSVQAPPADTKLAPQGGAAASCHSWGARYTVYPYFAGSAVYVDADCLDVNKGDHYTSLFVNDMITNNNGQMAWQLNGGFENSCDRCSVQAVSSVGAWLVCNCLNDTDGWVQGTSVNLNDKITNRNGCLKPDFSSETGTCWY